MKWKTAILILTILVLLIEIASAQNVQIVERSCQGNYVIGKIVEENRITYRILDFCPYGCAYGYCLSKKEVPLIDIKPIYEVKACEDNVIFIEIKNEGTKGNVKINVEGEISNWIKAPSQITLYPNETKTIALIISVPCNATGMYSFSLIGSGVIDFYAPSSIKIIDKSLKIEKLPITTTLTPINIKALLVFIIVLFILFFAYKVEIGRKKKEEKFYH